MPLSHDSRAEEKLKALERAKFKVKQQWEYIDWKHTHLYPLMERLKAGEPVLGLEAGEVFDLVIDEIPDPTPPPAAPVVVDSPPSRRARKGKASKGARFRHRK